MALVVLWDIDHTLIDNAGVSKEIYAAAFRALTGHRPADPAITQGRTDRLIMRDMLRRHGVHEPGWAALETALAEAGHAHREVLRRRGRALPGVRRVLKEASLQAGWVSSVLTGNIAANAHAKLSAFALDALLDLPVGAYGADAELRPHLVDIARRRIQRVHGLPPDTPVVLVGDTPRDVEAALASSAHVIAVATGVDPPSALTAAGAPVVLPDLTDTARVMRLLEDAERG